MYISTKKTKYFLYFIKIILNGDKKKKNLIFDFTPIIYHVTKHDFEKLYTYFPINKLIIHY